MSNYYGFSDEGNANNNQKAFLGDRVYNPGEKLGDIVLVAATTYGKGKVLIFGDTSSFQNSALQASHQFMRRVFNWLTSSSPGESWSRYLTIIGAALLLIGVGFTLLKLDWDVLRAQYVAAAMLLAFLSTTLINSLGASLRPLEGKIACVDTSHLERVDLSFGKDDSLLGLTHNLMRNGFLPIEMDKFSDEQLKVSKLLVSIAPTKPFDSSEINTIKQLMDSGGSFILSIGWDELRGSQKLLREFGFWIENIPLGPVSPESNKSKIQFYNAWPISVSNPKAAEVICSFESTGAPLIVRQAHGSGQLILIGDPGFLTNTNLESFQSYIPENIIFLRDLLGKSSVSQGNRPIKSGIRWFYIQDFEQVASIPTRLPSLGLNAALQCCFLL